MSEIATKRPRGRPIGSKNKPSKRPPKAKEHGKHVHVFLYPQDFERMYDLMTITGQQQSALMRFALATLEALLLSGRLRKEDIWRRLPSLTRRLSSR